MSMQQMRECIIPIIIPEGSSFTETSIWEYPRQSIRKFFEGVPSEGEGIRLVKRSLGYLIRTGHFWLIPQLIWQSGMKYAGYFLGKDTETSPKVVLACTMSHITGTENKGKRMTLRHANFTIIVTFLNTIN